MIGLSAAEEDVREETLSARGISKMYPGHVALWAMDFEVKPGEVVALLGKNGAGKSTLVRILSGAISSDTGTLRLGPRELTTGSVQQFQSSGIATVHQELEDFTDMSVLDNLFVDVLEHAPRLGPILQRRRMETMAHQHFERIGMSPLDLQARCGDLSAAERRLVMIARALLNPATRFLILDEPTAQLGAHDVAQLFKVISRLREAGIGIVYVSHRLGEVLEICSRAVVLRDGYQVAALPTTGLDTETLIPLLTGMDPDGVATESSEQDGISGAPVPTGSSPGPVEFATGGVAVEGLTGGIVNDATLEIGAGEIVGLIGLVGSGRSCLGRMLVGLQRPRSGTHSIHGRTYDSSKFRRAFASQIAYIPEDRKTLGLFPGLSVAENVMISSLERVQRFRFAPLDASKIEHAGTAALSGLRVAMRSARQNITELSGGNQQKVLVGRALLSDASTYVLDEPTHGMDLLAKRDLVDLIRQLADRGAGVLWISSDITEAREVCDRLVVMHEGSIVAEFQDPAATPVEALTAAAFGQTDQLELIANAK